MLKNRAGQENDDIRLLCDIPTSKYSDWKYDEIFSELKREEVEEAFVEDIRSCFDSFEPCDEWISRTRRAILENSLFWIALEDNEWSLAVELLQKEDVPEGFQKMHFARYLEAIKLSLFKQFDSLGIYTGPWTAGFICREEVS